MSDSELSDINDDDDLVRRYENKNDETEVENDSDRENNILNEKVKTEDENTAKVVNPSVSKKRITRKLYVLNTGRLKEHKGIHTIEKLYKGFKFKGKGHEKEDLDRIMKRLEYWAFRLFPKLDFDDFLSKCEYLGHKKDLHTHMKKYRLGMITADDNLIQNDMIEDEIDDPEIVRTERALLDDINNDEFQKLFDETEQTTNQNL